MNKLIPVTPDVLDCFCGPKGANVACPFLVYHNELLCCARSSSSADEANKRREEDGLPPLRGNCSGLPLCLPNMNRSPDVFPQILINVQIGKKILRTILSYQKWDDFKIQAKNLNQDMYEFITNLIIDSLKKRSST